MSVVLPNYIRNDFKKFIPGKVTSGRGFPFSSGMGGIIIEGTYVLYTIIFPEGEV